MKPSFSSSLFLGPTRLGCCAAIALLTGCVNVRHVPDEVTSPPPPIIGSAPIVAHDAYARAIFAPSTMKEATLVMLVRSSAESPRAGKLKEPVVRAHLN